MEARYPIGHFRYDTAQQSQDITPWIEDIEELPNLIQSSTESLTEKKLQWTYRPEGWTILQVVHHLADSHMNSYIRFKLALTENLPTIKPYDEAAWAIGPEYSMPLSSALDLLFALHHKWVYLLRSLGEEELQKEFVHPEHGTHSTLHRNVALYAWHGKHHLAHIELAKRLNEL